MLAKSLLLGLRQGLHVPLVISAFKTPRTDVLVQDKHFPNPGFQEQLGIQADTDAFSVYSPSIL